MAGSSPVGRRSYQWSSPQRSFLSDLLGEDRNSEARHNILLETAKREHDRVRAEAERVYREHVQTEEHQRLLEAERQEQRRIELEEQLAVERQRLLALKAKKVPIPPLPEPQIEEEPPTPPKAPVNHTVAAPKASQLPTNTAGLAAKSNPWMQSVMASNGVATQNPAPQAPVQPKAAGLFASKPSPSAPAVSASASPGMQPARPLPTTSKPDIPEQGRPASLAKGSSPFQNARAPAPGAQQPDRYTVIHKNLKDLRRSMDQQTTTNRALKARMGDMRREIRKTVGQLTAGTGTNRAQVDRLINLLREATANPVQSQLVDPSLFVLRSRDPVDGAVHNESLMPSLFIYLLNIFSKAAVNQFLNEGGAKPETADPVGIVVANIFSDPEFHWRGQSLIDILLAKYRVSCPVLFGYRGSEKTEQGRRRLGWKKEGTAFISEQQHFDRMTGLGAGFGAIALRNFGKSKKQNPYPPSNYWTAMAKVVNTPAEEISNTQCVVLKAMIEFYERKFLDAYGTAAIAALRLALIEFPAKAAEQSSAVHSLQVLAQVLKRDTGLVLDQ